jgi:drug/metabolite transporter (DMT)-like permease
MVDLVLGIAAAVGASTLYSLGVAFQAMDAREAPGDQNLRLALAARLVRSRRWLLGTGLSIGGFPLQVLALYLAPLTVVQPALAVGLLVLLLVGERMLHERPGRYEYAAMTAIVLGVIGAGLLAPPHSVTHSSQRLTISLVLAALAAAALLPYLLRLLGRSWPELTMICAGLAYGWSGVATKLASDDIHGGHWAVATAWAASTALASGVGTLSEMSALQQRPAIQVAPVVFVVQTVVPIVLAPTLLEEHFTSTPLGGVPLSASILLLLVGATLLARSPLLLALMEPQRVSESSGSTESPSAASRETMPSRAATDAADPSTSTTSTSPARTGR